MHSDPHNQGDTEKMPFTIIRNDITKVSADAIVNTANPRPVIGSGVDSAIYKAAGEAELLAERKKIGVIMPGEAVYTPAFGLDAKYIIHTVGPVWQGGDHGEYETLAACYRHSLLRANYLGCKSIAFPMISTGVYGFPKDKALRIALDEIADFLMLSEMEVILVVFDKTAFDLSSSLIEGVRQFIDDNYVEEKHVEEYSRRMSRSLEYSYGRSRAERDTLFGNMVRGHARFDSAGEPEESEVPDESKIPETSKIQEASEVPEASKIPEASEVPEASKTTVEDALSETDIPEGDIDMAPLAATAESIPLESEEEFDAYFHDLYEGSLAPKASQKSTAAHGLAHAPAVTDSLEEAMKGLGLTFQQKLLSLIDEKGFSDTQVYKKANIDRKLFSKIRCNVNYKPSKATVLALAISLELDLDETVDLLKRAGLALQPCSKSDLIVQYCIVHQIYDIFEVNSILFEYDQLLLGA